MKSAFLLHNSRRSISTGLASTFNKIHGDLKYHSYVKRTGLFNIAELREPEGFDLLKNEALVHANELVNKIVSTPSNGVVVPLFDDLSNCLCKVADLAEFVRVAHPQVKFREHAEQASIDISTLVEKLNTDKRLYNSLQHSQFKDEIDRHVAKLFMVDFEQSGIHLDNDKKDQVLDLNESILRLGSIFAYNSNKVRHIDRNQLPENVKNIIGLKNPDRTFLTSLYADSHDESVRETAYKLHLKYDESQDEILTQLLKYRLELAQMCGFPSYAHRAIKGGIAGSPEVVNDFLGILSDRIRSMADHDYAQLLSMKKKDLMNNVNLNSTTTRLNAWDVPFYSASFKRSIYNERVIQCLPYFSIGVCMDGLNMIFNQLYGVRMQVDDCKMGELWHEDVIKLSIIDDGTNEIVGYIYCDLFERPMKAHQDCHHTIRGGCQLADGSYQKPIVVLMLSLPDSRNRTMSTSQDKHNHPTLLAPTMVDNLFHEMGHAMHSMMARTKYQHITGTRCSTDLAEVPSILMEFFASDPRVISKFARHYSSGEQMPQDLIKCWIKSKKLFMASETQLQLFYAALDQSYHSANVFSQGESSTDILARCQKQFYSIDYVPNTAWQLRFSHLVGYGAKYYSYLVSRAIATAIWSKLFATNPLNRIAGLQYKDQVLRHGGGKAADQIASDVLGCNISADFMASSVISSFKEPSKLFNGHQENINHRQSC